MKILVIEDDRLLVDAYKLKLKKLGFETRVATDGQSGIKALEKEIPDVIIMDISLPGLTGVEVLEKIESNDKFAKIPVVVITNVSFEKIAEKINELGVSEIISKTEVSFKDLPNILRRVIKESSMNIGTKDKAY